MTEEERLELVPPPERAPCRHGSWVNVAPTPEHPPKMEFYCAATKGRSKHLKRRCPTRILFEEKS